MKAAYIINRLPSKVIGSKTPYEILFGKVPGYEHMRVFGCLLYVRNTETKGDTFEVRGTIGYPQGQKGYKVFDADNNKIITSRDVRFVEYVFPFTTGAKKNKDEDDNLCN